MSASGYFLDHIYFLIIILISWSFRLTTALKCCTIISPNSCKHFVTEGGVDSTCPLSRCVSSASSNFHFMQDLLFFPVWHSLQQKSRQKKLWRWHWLEVNLKPTVWRAKMKDEMCDSLWDSFWFCSISTTMLWRRPNSTFCQLNSL